MFLIDTHCHLYSEDFDLDLQAVIDRAVEAEVKKIFLPNIDEASTARMHAITELYPNLLVPMMGLHPCSVKADYESVLANMLLRFDTFNYCAVGEIGIDLYWDSTFKAEQIHAFEIQIEWAKTKNLPIVIHVRNSFDEVFEVLDRLNNDHLRGIFHCFSGNLDQAHHALSYGGFKLGLGGVLTFKKSGLDQVISEIELEDLVLETDSPYLAPTPHRGKRNEPAYVRLVAQKLAEIKGLTLQQIAEQTTINALTIFEK